ncbi:MAG: hypothetical protein HQL37_16380 [Alphaproteobacteria bacterium]|nr:hypothetical protein [Alphaproteobacteria bacterium]
MGALESHIAELRAVCAGLPDPRKGPAEECRYSMADIGVSAFSLLSMGCPSFLAHQRALEEGHGRSNCETLFGISAIPSDNYMRLMLDGGSPAEFDGLYFNAVETVAADRMAEPNISTAFSAAASWRRATIRSCRYRPSSSSRRTVPKSRTVICFITSPSRQQPIDIVGSLTDGHETDYIAPPARPEAE